MYDVQAYIETVAHFLLQCPKHSRHRSTMYKSVRTVTGLQSRISTRLLLGNPLNLNQKRLRVIFKSVLRFISKSGTIKRLQNP